MCSKFFLLLVVFWSVMKCDICNFDFRELIVEQKLPWISLTAHGYADSPVSWSGREHGYFVNGDNLMTLVLHPKNSFWMYLAYGTNDHVS
jgi:Ribonuclease P 40kDa (Rpp40) subunit